MHQLNDQYEVEPRGHYSGSYNDVLTYRDMLETNSQFKREVIASKIGGITSKLEEKKLLYTQVLNLVSGSSLGSSVNFNQTISQEQYFDSFGPNIVEVSQKNNVALMVFNYLNLNARPTLGDPELLIPSTPISSTLYLVFSDGPNPYTSIGNLSDHIWPSSFPFQGNYKNITRVLQPSNKLPNAITVSQSFLGGVKPTTVTNIGGIVYIFPRPLDSQIYLSPFQYVMDMAIAPSNSLGTIAIGGNFNSGSQATIKYFQSVRANYETIAKTIFGIGNGILAQGTGSSAFTLGTSQTILRKKIPSYRDFINTLFGVEPVGSVDGGGVYHFGPILRGTKYGMINPLPLSTKCIFRLGRYGQLRDMLEQRLYSKMYTSDTAGRRFVAEGVVTIKFKSGTTAASASNAELTTTDSSTVFNPTDSGQFNFEYRSGQPFFDDIDLELYRNF